MRSLWTLFREEPLLREASVIGALTFASFSCFWTTLAYMLNAHYGLGPGVAGTFGIVGAAGAMVAPFAGWLADKRGTRFVVTVAGAVFTGSYVWLMVMEGVHASATLHMAALVVGVVTLDLGQQMMQVSNQTRIFGLGSGARSRLNTIYMTIFFAGGAAGSALAGWAWSRWGWNGVCAVALGLIGLAGVRHATGYSRGRVGPLVHEPARECGPV